jgi:hypothetical protein
MSCSINSKSKNSEADKSSSCDLAPSNESREAADLQEKLIKSIQITLHSLMTTIKLYA